MQSVTQKPTVVVLCILDGWGISQDSPGNAITRAKPVNFNNMWFSYPHTVLVASGQAVGLPEGQVGNSEVGHINLGAGRVVFQDLLRVNDAIADGTFFENPAFHAAISHIVKNNSEIHLMGLVGLGVVHSHTEHLYALLQLLQKNNVSPSRVKLHLFTDGRDSPPTSAKSYVAQLKERLEKSNLGQIASISGRYYSMDRDNRWDRTAKSYFALLGKSDNKETDPVVVIDKSYARNVTDEFIVPTVITDASGTPIGKINNDDAVIFFNFRPDRARQLTKAFVFSDKDLSNIKSSSGEKINMFKREAQLKNLFFVSLTRYEKNLPVADIAFVPEEVIMPLTRVIAERNLRQLHIAETEKYAHVTYFFNGGVEKTYQNEDRILVPSPKVASYVEKPEMSAAQITQKLLSKLDEQSYSFIVVNYANADMVAHSGNIEATIRGVQAIDFQLGLISKAITSRGGGLIITADHGNAEEMINLRTGQPDTEHNLAPVPALFVFKELQGQNKQLQQGLLADIAPTILATMQIPKPSTMTGRSLL